MSNAEKSRALGMNASTAQNRLRKMIMWRLVQQTGQDFCFRCDKQIARIEDLSIEHKEPWQFAADPKASFFDLDNIAFSHLSCNSKATSGGGVFQRAKEQCPQGHKYDEENTSYSAQGHRTCKKCRNKSAREHYQRNPEARKSATRKWQRKNRERWNAYIRERYHSQNDD